MTRTFTLAALLLAAATPAFATEFHVSASSGNDTGDGSAAHPLKTIQAAAQKAMPGDTVTVHAGMYRERINPPRGGTDDAHRIVYHAAPGEKVTITGSEPAEGWTDAGDGVWTISLPEKFFGGGVNPFDEQLYGSWFDGKKRPHHTGFVVSGGKPMHEVFSETELVKSREPAFLAKAPGNGGSMLMNIEWLRVGDGQPLTFNRGVAKSADSGILDSALVIGPPRIAFGYLEDGATIRFKDVDFGEGADTAELQAATLAHSGRVELRLGDKDGKLLGIREIPATGDWMAFKQFPVKLAEKISGKQTVTLVIRAPKTKTGVTTLRARFPSGVNPNTDGTEIAVRPAVFFPEATGIGYITVRGFTLENAATNWASPNVFQPGLIGPHWSRGWIIEGNEIRNSRCAGVSLGRPASGHKHHDSKDQDHATPGQADKHFTSSSWTKSEAGGHLVRNNQIHDCGEAGIIGSSGGAFSIIDGNDIHDIFWDWSRGAKAYNGSEMACIKLHFAIDTVIRDNRLSHANRGLWLDWGVQGLRIEGNLFHDNAVEDFFPEVGHGPFIFANNILLSKTAVHLTSQGVAFAHNLVAGGFSKNSGGELKRTSFFYPAHDTVPAGRRENPAGDTRWFNNVLANGATPAFLAKPQNIPSKFDGNVLLGATKAAPGDTTARALPQAATPKLVERNGAAYLVLADPHAWRGDIARRAVTSDRLGKAVIPNLPFENADGSPATVKTDYFGKPRGANPFPGPFETPVNGEVKVWPK